MALDQEVNRDRIKAGIGVAAFHALLGYALIMGLGIDVAKVVDDKLKIFDVPRDKPPPPPKPPEPPKQKAKAPEGAAAPPSLKAKPTPIVAPPPKVRLKVPPPVTATPKPTPLPPGSQNSAGVSTIAGTGTGNGGVGDGTGSGGQGTGAGGGGNGLSSRVQRVGGGIANSDFPEAASRSRASGIVHVRIAVAPDGRVQDCSVVRSSGHEVLDSTTCQLIEERFRYRPARDAAGRPVAAVEFTYFTWQWRPPSRRGRSRPPAFEEFPE